MKKNFLKIVAGALAIISLTSCGGTEPGEANIETKEFSGTGYLSNDYFALKETNGVVPVNGTYQLILDSLPTAYSPKNLKFSSKNESVAKVDANGLVSGVAKGITDIEVKSDDGKVNTVFHALVGEKSSSIGAKSVINNIVAAKEDPSYEKPTKFFLREYDIDTYSCEGVDDHGYESFETMAFDYDTGYFMVQSEDLQLKVPGGVKEKFSGKWLFYTIGQGQFTRLIRITENSKTFYDINTSAYLYEGEAILSVLDMFFASGRKIVQDMLDDVANERFESNVSDSSNVYVAGTSAMSYTVTEKGKDKVDVDDEINYFDIPEGTDYTYDYVETDIQNGDKLEGLNVSMVMSYERDGKPWQRRFIRSMAFSQDFEFEKYNDPEHNGFTKVDSIYDL